MQELTNYISIEELENTLHLGEYGKDIQEYLPNMKDYFIEVLNFVGCEGASKASDTKLFEVANKNQDAFNKFVDNEYRGDSFDFHNILTSFMGDLIYDSLYNNKVNLLVYASIHYLLDAHDNLIVSDHLVNMLELGFLPSSIYTYILQSCMYMDITTNKMEDIFNMVQSAINEYSKSKENIKKCI